MTWGDHPYIQSVSVTGIGETLIYTNLDLFSTPDLSKVQELMGYLHQKMLSGVLQRDHVKLVELGAAARSVAVPPP